MTAYDSYGTLLKRGSTTIGQVRSVGSTATKEFIDVTHLATTDKWREKLPSFRDGGQVQFEILLDPGDASHQVVQEDYESDELSTWSIVFSDDDATTWTFSAGVADFQPAAALGEALIMSVTLEVSGAIDFG
jgi:predicted secreted protein